MFMINFLAVIKFTMYSLLSKLEEAVEFCDKADIPIDRVNSNAPWILEDYPFEPRKIHAVEYIDDKNKIHQGVCVYLWQR